MATLPRSIDPRYARLQQLEQWGYVIVRGSTVTLTEKGWSCLVANADAPIHKPMGRATLTQLDNEVQVFALLQGVKPWR